MTQIPVINMVATGQNITRLRKQAGLSVANLQQIFGFTPVQARPYVLATLLLAPVFYYLAYRAFCHARIANHNRLGL